MDTVEVFQSGNSQAVRLPRRYCFESGEVFIFRRGDDVILREKPWSLEHAFSIICLLPDFEREDAPPQDREGL